jgi:hypothetical protein
MPLLSQTPSWYWLLAILVSIYHAYRGFMVQWIFAHQQNHEFKAKSLRAWSTTEIVVIRCLEDSLFYLICSLTGFLALLVASDLWRSHAHREVIDAGASVLIVFTFLLGVIGVSGQLPPLIQLGRFPGAR